MELAEGAILEGKVTGITKFGAFVALPEGKSGMVHISEIAYTYVNDINEYLTIGQEVKVKVISIEGNKINLSIKKTQEPPPRQNNRQRSGSDRGGRYNNNDRSEQRSGGNDRRSSSQDQRRQSSGNHSQNSQRSSGSKEPQSFDDMLKQFMADSDSKISSIRQYSDHRTRSKRRQ